VTFDHTGRNQNGDIVATARRAALMWFSDAHERARSDEHVPATGASKDEA
jgi:hypothetical protein